MGDNAFNEALTAKRAREYTHQNALALTPRQEAIRSAVGNAFASMIPGVGDVMDAREGYDTLREAGGDFERGDYLSGIGNTLSGAAIGASALIPFLGMGGIKRAVGNVGDAVSEGRRGGGDTVVLYHGTTPDSYDSIQASGAFDSTAFFTPSRRGAEDYAANVGGDDSTVIAVRVPKSALLIDTDASGARLMSVEDAAQYLGEADLSIEDFIRRDQSFGVERLNEIEVIRDND
jgi:hypothetical protein